METAVAWRKEKEKKTGNGQDVSDLSSRPIRNQDPEKELSAGLLVLMHSLVSIWRLPRVQPVPIRSLIVITRWIAKKYWGRAWDGGTLGKGRGAKYLWVWKQIFIHLTKGLVQPSYASAFLAVRL